MPERYEEEIDELLRRMGFSSRPKKRRVPIWRGVAGYFRRTWALRPRGPGQLMLVSLALLIVAFILWSPMRDVARVLGVVGFLLLIVAYISSLIRPTATYQQKRWRGQIIELPRRTSFKERLYRWFYRRR